MRALIVDELSVGAPPERVAQAKRLMGRPAIELDTQAVDVDPYAEGAREALLERARPHLAGGDLELAGADLFRLKRRPDAAMVKEDVEALLEQIAGTRKASSQR